MIIIHVGYKLDYIVKYLGFDINMTHQHELSPLLSLGTPFMVFFFFLNIYIYIYIYIYIIFCFIMWLMQPHVTPNSLVSGMFNFQSSSF